MKKLLFKMKMKKLYFTAILLFLTINIFATHNRAGQIIYKQISDLTYEITVITYTSTLPGAADRPQLDVQFGDGTVQTVDRCGQLYLPNNYKRNCYTTRHTYPGAGTYEIVMEDPNRNPGVINIPGSVNTVFTIKTTLQINPALGYNNTPILLNPPIDVAAKGRLFIHNPGAYDPDGDSLSYKLTTCLGSNGDPIPDYQLPESSNRPIFVDSITGDLIWDAPMELGNVNVAIEIDEWRKGIKIGRIIRDMQITVMESDNYPPEFSKLDTICVVAGDTAEFQISAIDSSYDYVRMIASGGPFIVDSSIAQFDTTPGFGYATGRFTWATNCTHVRLRPYQVTFKAYDSIPEEKVPLVNFTSAFIKVIAPPVVNIQSKSTNKTIILSWDKSECSKALGYAIYRKEEGASFFPEYCQTGIPSEYNYHLIAKTDNLNDTSFIDNDNGKGLLQGHNYCYRILTYYEDGGLSKSSKEICASTVRGIPVFTQITVDKTDNKSGEMTIKWEKPTDFDTILAPGPYLYHIYRSYGIWGNNLELIDSTMGIDNTIYMDKNLNTQDSAYSYSVEFINNTAGNRFLVGKPQVASSSYLKLSGENNSILVTFLKNVPWIDTAYTVYTYDKSTQLYDSLLTTSDDTFKIRALSNGLEYCYRVKTHAYYTLPVNNDTIFNFTQRNCTTPIDTIPPCQPPLNVISLCDSFQNILTWQNPKYYCDEEAIGYKIFYSPTLDGKMKQIDEINTPVDTTYTHFPEISLAGCYAIQAIDSAGNESSIDNRTCIDNCNSAYRLPNVFTPDNDGINDIYIPLENEFIEKVDMKIYNRYGVLIFETTDPNINWNGNDKLTNRKVVPGIYYYVCDVYEPRLSGLVPRAITGFIHVFYGKKQNSGKK